MVDSSWKSRGNVSVHSANSCSSLGPNFRTRACKASQGSCAFGEGCMGGGWLPWPLPQPRTVHVAVRGSSDAWGRWASPSSVPGDRRGVEADHGERRGTDTCLEWGPSLTHNCQSSYLPFCGGSITFRLRGPPLPHLQLALPQAYRNIPDKCWPVRAWHWPAEGHAA